ncbi:hypothetical protein SAMN03080594_101995 [Arenibacter palladensis]|uniref:GmrSD restriction endonucleases N-terminal domain-containing protein n=1 Tax=Arenibacter palladensis TaxID=237373 RepID=A0A1M4VJ34_9FLAO|nr:DUF262 domain-containing protein [Arenibacter palladensis]SHE68994.1 hypothetical protein SAMN03080594_101995 [Arenibacter palladensis]
MKYRDPKPDIQRIEEIVNGVISGDIRLPKFQRPFVWKRKEVIKLLDSIYNGYPIGSILLWQSSEELASERNIAELELEQPSEYYPTNYLLDGQQRVSSLCGTLFWDGKNSKSLWNVAFDLDKERFIYPKDELKIEYFPLNKLLNTSDFITQCKAFEAHPKKEKLFKNAEKLLRSIKDYKIAVVKIGEMTINEVAPIFERINSTGRKLTIVDLMRAATWKGDFDLNDAIKQVNEVCESKGYYDISENHILRNISACAGLGINREDVDKLRTLNSTELKEASSKCREAYDRAIHFIQSHFPLPSSAFLPYSLQLTYMVEFFNRTQEPMEEQISHLKTWFWKTSISRHFGASNTGQNSRDLQNIRDFAEGSINTIPIDKEIGIDNLCFDDFRLNVANSKTFSLILAINNPIDFFSGEAIDLTENLSSLSRNNFGFLSNNKDLNVKACINVFLKDSHTIDLNDLELLDYTIKKFPEKSKEIFNSHYLDELCITYLKEGKHSDFINQRKNLIANKIIDLLGNERITSQVEYDPYEEDEEGNSIE